MFLFSVDLTSSKFIHFFLFFKEWNNVSLNPSLRLPAENEFIPTDFSIRERPQDVSIIQIFHMYCISLMVMKLYVVSCKTLLGEYQRLQGTF